jgi:transposase-like protein
MGQVLHRGAATTEAIRRATQPSHESLRTLAHRHGINPKTVAKWRKRCSVADLRTGPKHPRSTVLTVQEEAVIVAFRRHTPLPLDDCLYALQATIPHLTRSSLHRYLEHHGISRLPEVEGGKPGRKKFDSYPIGFFHIDLAEVRTAEGKLYLFVAIDRTSKFAFVELVERVDMRAAAAFLQALIAAVPYRIHTVLPTTASSLLIFRKIERDQPPAFAGIPSIAPACCMASITDIPNRTIPGPTARSSA